ncbi:MAG TPA: hypothetical protein VGP33_09775, partial [Chloroflexota bacterium]|nr:hypothetical protein [Chloroflexota bacterium]
MLIRFAFLAAFPLACMACTAFLLFQTPGLQGTLLSLAIAVLVLLLIAVAFTVANLRAAYDAERITNAALTELGRQALQVAGVQQHLGGEGAREGGVSWLTAVFQSMVDSLQRERTQVSYRLSDLERLNTIAGTIIDTADPTQYEQRLTESLIRIMRAAGAVFVATQPDGTPAVIASAGLPSMALTALGQARLAEPPSAGTPLTRALQEAKISARDVGLGALPAPARA